MSNKKPDEIVLDTNNDFLSRGWINLKCGGIAIRHTFANDKIYYLRSAELVTKKREFVDFEDVETDFNDDLCAGLWKKGFLQLGAGAVAHTASANGMVIADWYMDSVSFSNYESLTSMTEHLVNGKYVLPIIPNSADLGEAIFSANPPSAVLVRGHGLFVWGKTPEQTRERCMVLEQLFLCQSG